MKLGEVKKGRLIGKESSSHDFIWAKCPGCGYTRWVHAKSLTDRRLWDPKKFPCRGCAGAFYQQGLYDAVEGWKVREDTNV